MDSPLGLLTIESDGAAVTALRFGDRRRGGSTCAVLEQAAAELAEYFAGERMVFSVALAPAGTVFQCSVWDALRTIPYGVTVSYAEIAKKIGSPKACRAVGGANNKNPLPIFIPCHRVVGADGKPVGYAGGIDRKLFLIGLEKGELA